MRTRRIPAAVLAGALSIFACGAASSSVFRLSRAAFFPALPGPAPRRLSARPPPPPSGAGSAVRRGSSSSSSSSAEEDRDDGKLSSRAPFPPVPVRSHHACVKTRSMEMALAFYSLLGYAPEAKFRAGPARAAWLTNAPSSASASSANDVPSRIEIIEVPPDVLDEAEGVRKRAADRFGNPALLGWDHVCLDVTGCVRKARAQSGRGSDDKDDSEGSSSSSSSSYGLSEWMDDLQSASQAKFGKTLRVALAPRVKRIGRDLIEMAYIYDADGSLLELLNCDVRLSAGGEGEEAGEEESSWDDEDDGRIVWKAG